MARRNKIRGYNPETGSFVGWFAKWYFFGAIGAMAFIVLIVYLAGKKVERQKEQMYRDYAAETSSS